MFALLRLLPVSDRDKDVEIVVLRHQIAFLQRQPGAARPRFSRSDRAFLAALLHQLPRDVPARFRLLVRPGTVLRWHRDLLARRHTARSRPGRPGTAARRALGPPASAMREILRQAGIDPAPERVSATRASFLRSQAQALLACDFFETVTVTGARLFVLAVIEHATRRIRILGTTPPPAASRAVQAARKLMMDLGDAGGRARFMVRDRDGRYPALSGTVLTDAGTEIVPSGVQMPGMNAVTERWVLTCRRELPDRTLIWIQRHLLHALPEFGQFCNAHRPRQGIASARPLRALPSPIPLTDVDARLRIDKRDRLGGILHEYRHAALPARMKFSASTAP